MAILVGEMDEFLYINNRYQVKLALLTNSGRITSAQKTSNACNLVYKMTSQANPVNELQYETTKKKAGHSE